MRHLIRRFVPLALACAAPLAAAAPALTQADETSDALAKDVFRELIEINTTDTPVGNVTLASEAMARRLRDAGFAAEDMQVVGPNDRKKNLVARLRGTGKHKPLLLIGHSMSSRRSVRTGRPIPSSSSRRTACTTGAARRT